MEAPQLGFHPCTHPCPLRILHILHHGKVVALVASDAGDVAKKHKHKPIGPKYQQLGWICIPLVAETYGRWGKEGQNLMVIFSAQSKPAVTAKVKYNELCIHLGCVQESFW